MISLEKEISLAKFEKLSREIYAVNCSNGSTTYYLTLNSAYTKMEKIRDQLKSVLALDRQELHDLDVRPVLLVTDAGCVYSLLTLPLNY